MRAVPDTTATSNDDDGIDCELDDDAWKQNLKNRIEEDFQSMVADARENLAIELSKAPDTLEARIRLEADYIQAIQTIKNLASEQYKLELDRERNQRSLLRTVDVPMNNPSWSTWSQIYFFRQEQQNIMNSIKQSNQTDSSVRTASESPTEEPRGSAISTASNNPPAQFTPHRPHGPKPPPYHHPQQESRKVSSSLEEPLYRHLDYDHHHQQARSPNSESSSSSSFPSPHQFTRVPPSFDGRKKTDYSSQHRGSRTTATNKYDDSVDEDTDDDDDNNDDEDDDDSSEKEIEAKKFRHFETRKQEKTKQNIELETQKMVEDLKKKEEEAHRKDLEMKKRENLLQWRVEELLRREADIFRREEEAKKKQEEALAKQEEGRKRKGSKKMDEEAKREEAIQEVEREEAKKKAEALAKQEEARKREESKEKVRKDEEAKQEAVRWKEGARTEKVEARREAKQGEEEARKREVAIQEVEREEAKKRAEALAKHWQDGARKREELKEKVGRDEEAKREAVRRKEETRTETMDARRAKQGEEEGRKYETRKRAEALQEVEREEAMKKAAEAKREEDKMKHKLQAEAKRKADETTKRREEDLRREQARFEDFHREQEEKCLQNEIQHLEDKFFDLFANQVHARMMDEQVKVQQAEFRKKEEEIRRARMERKRNDGVVGNDNAWSNQVDAKLMDEQVKVQQAEFRKKEEEIRRAREERKRNGGVSNDNAWSNPSYFSNLPGKSPNMSRFPQFNGPPIPERSTGPSTGGRRAVPSAWRPSPSMRPTAAAASPTTSRPSARTSTGRARGLRGSVRSRTYPTSSPHTTAFFSEAERIRRQQEFAESQQEQFRRAQEQLEAERQLRSAGRSLSREEWQRILEHHERLWTRLNTLDELSWNDFPWPMAKQPSNPEDMSLLQISAYIQSPPPPPPLYPDKDKSRTPKDRIKEHIKRWHPDRFETKLLPKVVEDEREKVKHGAGNVARYLSDLLRKENEK